MKKIITDIIAVLAFILIGIYGSWFGAVAWTIIIYSLYSWITLEKSLRLAKINNSEEKVRSVIFNKLFLRAQILLIITTIISISVVVFLISISLFVGSILMLLITSIHIIIIFFLEVLISWILMFNIIVTKKYMNIIKLRFFIILVSIPFLVSLLSISMLVSWAPFIKVI